MGIKLKVGSSLLVLLSQHSRNSCSVKKGSKSNKISFLPSCLLALAASVSFPGVASADRQPPTYQTPADVMENAYFRHDRNFYENGSPSRVLDSLVGTGKSYRDSFPENEMAADGELINSVYRDMLTQQSTNDPYLRTPDLPNPYSSSLLMTPQYNRDKLRLGTEYYFEIVQPR
ncbi:MAG TPA: hypothetical protein VK184_26505 [Nostocaceae cyanobacterium]|nr:hypothetical protein [Nostocaceae cyanobacterium]